MKIDFYISSLSGGGAERVLLSVASALSDRGNEVGIISLEKRPQFYEVDERIEVIRIENKGKAGALKDFFAVGKLLKKRKADLSVSFLLRCNLIVSASALFTDKKIVVSDRNNPLMEHSKGIFRLKNLLYRRANAVVVQTEKIKALYDGKLQEKMFVVENPLDIEKLEEQVCGKPLPERREKTILSMGRLEPQKDFKTLIRAFDRIGDKYPDWVVKIFGVGRMEEELKAEIADSSVRERVLLCGRTDLPFYEMKKASVFVLSSFYEGFPNVLCEAMAAGDLCVASDCVSGPSELIENGVNGALFPVGDEVALAEKLEEYMENAEKLQTVRQRAQETVKRLYPDKNIENWERVFEIALKGEANR